MRYVAGSEKAPNSLIYGSPIKRHSMIFNVMLLLAIITLVAFAAFLISDILSFKSNASYEESFSVFSFLNSKESVIAMKDRQEVATNLTDQGMDREPGKGQESGRVLENTTANNSSRADIWMPLSPLNKSEPAKGVIAMDDNAAEHPNPAASTNSSPSNTSTLTRQASRTAVVISKSLDSESHKSAKKKKHSSSKNDIQVDRDGASPLSTAIKNQSPLNQSQSLVNLSINLSSNISLNLSTSSPKKDATEIHPNLSYVADTDIFSNTNIAFVSSGNSSVNTNASSQLAMNSTIVSNSTALDDDLVPVAGSSSELNADGLSLAGDGNLNPDVDAAIGPEDEVLVEPSVPAEQPFPDPSRSNSMPRAYDDLENDSLDDRISDELADFNPGIDTEVDEGFADPGTMDNGIAPLGDVSSEPNYPEHSAATEGEETINSPEGPTSFASPQLDKFANNDLDSAKPHSEIVPARKSSSKSTYQWQNAKDKRISNRDKSAKSLKKPAPPTRPTRTRPVKPTRDNSRD